MFSALGGEIKCLWGILRRNELMFGVHNACNLINQNNLLKTNELISKHLLRRFCGLRSAEEAYDSQSGCDSGQNILSSSRFPVEYNDCKTHQKIVKVAVVGTPNAGKSTFINQLVKRRVCSISSKVHTTRNRAKAIVNEGDIQIVFLDTPGLVNATESKKHNLEKSFFVDAELCMEESDLVVVIHDASNIWTRDKLNVKVLKLLHFYPKKSSVLVLNKVDSLKSKRKLLDLTKKLTCGSLNGIKIQNNDQSNQEKYHNDQLFKDGHFILPIMNIDKVLEDEVGWPCFENVFIISALKGEGIDAIKECILQKARPSPWLYPPTVFTDQKLEDMILLAVREKLLESLPQEIPYNIETELEHLNISPAGDVSAIVLIKCAYQRHAKMLLSVRGKKIREVAKSAEQAMESTLMQNVRLNLVVQYKK